MSEELIFDLPLNIEWLIKLNLIVPTRKTKDGKIIEYRLTHSARVLLSRCQ